MTRKLAVGAVPPPTSSVCVVSRSSVVLVRNCQRDGVGARHLEYECVAVRPLPVEPSPKFHEYDAIGLFGGAVLVDASNSTVLVIGRRARRERECRLETVGRDDDTGRHESDRREPGRAVAEAACPRAA